MKLFIPQSNRKSSAVFATVRAFTITEMLTVMAIFMLLAAATISTQLWGMRMYRISESKLTMAADARNVLNHVRDEIRSAKEFNVGTGDGSSFTPVPDNKPQIGNALKIHPADGTNNFVCYFWDAGDSSLKRRTSSGQSEIIASGVTNQYVFQAEDFMGNVLTHQQKNWLIKTTLQFHQRQYWSARVANGAKYEDYQLQTRIARRTD